MVRDGTAIDERGDMKMNITMRTGVRPEQDIREEKAEDGQENDGARHQQVSRQCIGQRSIVGITDELVVLDTIVLHECELEVRTKLSLIGRSETHHPLLKPSDPPYLSTTIQSPP